MNDRITFRQCAHHRGECTAWRAAKAVRGYAPDADLKRRCDAFAPRRAERDQRAAAERWPGLAAMEQWLRKQARAESRR